MSSNAPMREVAQRAFAREFNDATHTFRESDDDRAPVYVLLPTGAKANRVFVVGTLTETQDVGHEEEYWQGRIVDPTGTFFAYAGQYQPEAAGMLRETEPPAFVAVVGKPRTYETDDGSVNVSLRPENLTVVDETTRDRWVAETAERTLDRIEAFDDPGNEYAQMARDEYGDAIEQYREAILEAVETLGTAPSGPADEPPTGEEATVSGDTAGSADTGSDPGEIAGKEDDSPEAATGTERSGEASGNQATERPAERETEAPSTDFDASGSRGEEPTASDVNSTDSSDTEPISDRERADSTPQGEVSRPEREEEDGADGEQAETSDSDEIEAAVVEAVKELDEGDGADEGAVIEQVASSHEVDHGTVEEAIEGTLMTGKCFRPADGRLEAI